MRPRYERWPKLYCPDVIEFHCGLNEGILFIWSIRTLKYNKIIIKNLYFISFLVEVSGPWLQKQKTSVEYKQQKLTAFQNAQRARNRHYSISARTHSDSLCRCQCLDGGGGGAGKGAAFEFFGIFLFKFPTLGTGK